MILFFNGETKSVATETFLMGKNVSVGGGKKQRLLAFDFVRLNTSSDGYIKLICKFFSYQKMSLRAKRPNVRIYRRSPTKPTLKCISITFCTLVLSAFSDRSIVTTAAARVVEKKLY